MIEQGFAGSAALESDIAALERLERHLSSPEVLVTSHLFYQLSGRVPHTVGAFGQRKIAVS